MLKIAISSQDQSDHAASRVKKSLEEIGVQCDVFKEKLENAKLKQKAYDCVVVTGGDKGVRSFFHKVTDSTTPVIGINESESGGFFAQIDLKDFPSLVKRIKKGDYIVEKVTRIDVSIDKNPVFPVLNEVSIFPAKSAVLMEHVLRVDNEEVWHDSSDGIIISTPIGSSAYSLSAGGPVIFQNSKVFGVVSVSSLDITRRPLIVPEESSIEVDDISSNVNCEVILDGRERKKVKKIVECKRFSNPAHIIRMKKDSTAVSALAKKVRLAEELLDMPPSSKLLLKTLEYEGPLTQNELATKTLLPDRTIRLALSHLLERGLVKKRSSIRDARQKIYEIPK